MTVLVLKLFCAKYVEPSRKFLWNVIFLLKECPEISICYATFLPNDDGWAFLISY